MSAPLINDDTESWISLRRGDFEIFVASFTASPDRSAVVISGTASLSESEAHSLASAGFVRVPGKSVMFARSGSRFKFVEISTAFPSATAAKLPKKQVRRTFSGTNPTPNPAGSTPFADPRIAAATAVAPATKPALVAQAPAFNPTPRVPDAEIPEDATVALPYWDADVDLSLLEVTDDVELRVDMANEFQAHYRPASRIGDASTMVPVNMAEPLAQAFDGLRARYGDVDELVSNALGWSRHLMADRLTPEQVDAVALFIKNLDDGKALILADQTGVGKGRVLAACAVVALNRGQTVIFITETSNLFSDFWRDIRDIDAEAAVGTPFIMNRGEKIFDLASEEPRVLHASLSAKEQDAILASGLLPPGCRFCFSTYSQFNNPKNKKVAYLKAIAAGALLIEDEAHNAAGDSNVSGVINDIESVVAACLYSSATFAAKPENMRSYQKALPDFFQGQDIADVLKVGGQVLQSALAQGMVADGRLLRREHDLSGIEIKVDIDQSRASQHRVYADALAAILSKMARVSRQVGERVDRMNELNAKHCETLSKERAKLERVRFTSGNFGGRLSLISRQFLVALLIDSCIENNLRLLNAGDKTVIVIDTTMESIMRELQGEGDQDVWLGHPTFGSMAGIYEGERAPSFSDVLAVMMRRILTIKVRRGNEDAEKVAFVEDDLMADAIQILDLIRDFPYLPISPMDAVREAIEAAQKPGGGNWKVGEITGRSLRVSNGLYEPKPQIGRNETVIAYNSGKLDVLFITRPGSAGLSLHASERVRDKRRRWLIELEIPSNVVNRIQRWGRVNRRGQVSVPGFLTLSTALPFQVRNMAIQNRKVADLSAHVTASAHSASLMDVPDILNSVGNDVCRRLLTSRPRWAEDMDISMQVEDDEDGLYFVNKLLFRLILLPSTHQENLYAAVLGAYADAVKELAARGLAPRKGREIAGEWRVTSRSVYDPGLPGDHSVFAAPVYETTISTEVDAAPINEVRLLSTLAEARGALAERFGRASSYFSDHIKKIDAERPRLLERSLSKKHDNVAIALRADGVNAVKLESQRLKELSAMLSILEPGATMTARNEDGDLRNAVITDIAAPDLSDAWFPGKYLVSYVFPGDEELREISISGMMRQDGLTVYPVRPNKDLVAYPAFRELPVGRITRSRKILDGNLFTAVRAAVDCDFGTAVTYRNSVGERRQGVLIPRSNEATFNARMRGTRIPEVAFEILRQGKGVLWTTPSRSHDGVVMRISPVGISVAINGDRRVKARYDTPEIADIFCGPLGKRASVLLPPSRAFRLLKTVIGMGDVIYFEGRHADIGLKAAACLSSSLANIEACGEKFVEKSEIEC